MHIFQNNRFKFTDNIHQYYQFSKWQADNINDKSYVKSITYWKEKLKGHNSYLNFPYDFTRKEFSTGLGEKINFTVNPKLKSDLQKFARSENVTDFMVYISAFSILLNRYSHDFDICIGIPSANRPHSELEQIIGFFVNTLVLRFEIDEHKTFQEYLSQNRKLISEALEHQDLPFEKLVEEIQPERFTNTNPIYQVLFAWLNTPSKSFELQGVTAEKYYTKVGVASLDISVYIWEENETLEGEIEYSTDILSSASMNLFIQNYLKLLDDISSNSSKKILELEVVSASEIEEQKRFNNTSEEIPPHLLHQLAGVTQKNASKKAVIMKDGALNYSDLDTQSNQLAHYLISQGVKPNDTVGICIDRSFAMIIGVHAILKSGAAYLPIDPLFPEDRKKYMLEDSGAKFLITQENYISAFSRIPVTSFCFKEILPHFKEKDINTPNVQIDKDNIAYIIYTSGSTGNPKGVKVHHEAVVNLIISMAKEPGFNSEDVLLAITTLSFDISILELFLPLYKGGSIVLAEADDIHDPEKLIWLMAKFNVNVIQATPATWNMLLRGGWAGNRNLKALSGGEAISGKLVEQLLPRVKELWNMYGPTETTVWSTCYQITSNDKPVLVGKPILNTSVYILSDNKKIVPIGVTGELCIGGLGVSKGYHNREDLTKKKFIEGPDKTVIYCTGDIGRFKVDGNIELFGRIDNQIKLRGNRIEPGEIETGLCKINGIKEAVVKVQKLSDIDERLVAFLLVDNSFSGTKETIISNLKVYFPNYMIPVAFKNMDKFPLTPNGKTDRESLTMTSADFDSGEKDPPKIKIPNKLEKKIQEIWKNELKISNIGLNDNFFEIGGNSVLLIHLSNKINQALGKKIDIIKYFQYPTIKSFCSHLK